VSSAPTRPQIGGRGLSNVAICGRGAGWWQRQRERTLAHPRPRLISLAHCIGVLIEGITAINSPSDAD
jgi:polygalacturonase